MSRKSKTTRAETAAALAADDATEPRQAGNLARLAFKLAGHTDATPDEYENRAAELAEVIDLADEPTRHTFARALLFAASAEWSTANNRKAIKDTAARAAAAFRLADQGRPAAEAAALAAGRTLTAGTHANS